MGNVWVVEVGDYSDRRVIAVCSTEDHAKEIVRITANEATYTSFTVDDYPSVPPDCSIWRVAKMTHGGKMDADYAVLSHDIDVTDWTGVIRPDTTFPSWSYVAARDADHAVKIVSEKWAMWKAMQPPHPTPA